MVSQSQQSLCVLEQEKEDLLKELKFTQNNVGVVGVVVVLFGVGGVVGAGCLLVLMLELVL